MHPDAAQAATASACPIARLAPASSTASTWTWAQCIGCKCCVVACNEQNGNPAPINWRRVGEIEGGWFPSTSRSYLSMGCNHCLEPTCLQGCPVDAYTKDPITGIVRHSADACIGCQYCTWNCSYGVPQYNPERGVVGKCDMCHGRLSLGQAPACVSACPEGALAIEIVNVAEWRAVGRVDRDALGLPSDDGSLSTTRITPPDDLPPNARPRDITHVTPEHAHWSLILMTVLTQLSVGAFATIWLLQLLGVNTRLGLAALVSLGVGGLALAAATFHLGRPAHAYRALRMWRRSWLSREVLAFAAFSHVAAVYAGLLWLQLPGSVWVGGLTVAARPRRRDRQRLHLSRSRPSGLEHALHAAAVQPDRRDPRTVVRGGRRRRCRTAGWRSAAASMAGAQATVFALRFFRAVASDSLELKGTARLLSTVLAGRLVLRGILLAIGAIALPLLATGSGRWTRTAAHARRAPRRARRRAHRTLSVLRQRRSQTSGRALYRVGKRGRMTLKEMLGLDTRADRYTYGVDPVAGYVSSQKIPDRWVSTTCGYCSVGCGMFIGVKDGRAVSVRGNPDHPVNRGMLCPKGLSEHHTIAADNRARYPLLRRGGAMQRVSWDDALTTMAARFRDVQARHGAGAVGVISTGQLVTEEFYAMGKLMQLGIGTSNYDGNTTLCMSTAVQGYKRSFGSDGPPGAYEDLERADVIVLIGANVAENHPILCWRLRSNPERHHHRRRSARHQDGDDGRSAPAASPALGPRAHQRPDSHRHRAQPDRSRVHRPLYDRVRGAACVGARVHAGARRRDHRPDARARSSGRHGPTRVPRPRSSAGRWA